jgi:hypothetical protein
LKNTAGHHEWRTSVFACKNARRGKNLFFNPQNMISRTSLFNSKGFPEDNFLIFATFINQIIAQNILILK